MDITAIVNVYKRPHVLDEQIEAIKQQTIPPKAIFIWNNGNRTVDLSKYKEDPFFRVFDNNHNFGVWSRFLLGFLAPTKYICVFDDDTIPGNRWFENCLNSMGKKEALYGTIGVIFPNTTHYNHIKRYGWDGPRDCTSVVDIVGHSWFFKRDWLSYFVREPPQVYKMISNGEDIHFSFMLQKYANISTLVPPHPSNDTSLWGSQHKTAYGYGCDGNSETGSHYPLDAMFTEYISRGFRILKERQKADSVSDFLFFKEKIRSKNPFALIRPADGEFYILQNSTISNIDHWRFNSGGKLHKDLDSAVRFAAENNVYVGIPCETCNDSMARWYVNHYNLNPLYTTFANVFVNKNWQDWINFLKDERIPFHFIGPSNNPSALCVQSFTQIPELLVNDWDTKAEETIEKVMNVIKSHSANTFFFSCGPIAKILIAKAWEINPTNTYIDVGSSLDLFLKGSTNRNYISKDSALSSLMCKFSESLFVL